MPTISMFHATCIQTHTHSPRVMGMLYMRCRFMGAVPMLLAWLLGLNPGDAMVSARDSDRAPEGDWAPEGKDARDSRALGVARESMEERRVRERLPMSMGELGSF